MISEKPKENTYTKGLSFEYFVRQLLVQQLGGATIQELNNRKPKKSGDGGKDFKLEISANIEKSILFGETLSSSATYYVEAKRCDTGKLQYATTSPNLSRVQNNEEIKGVFVVTNSYLSPSAYYDTLSNYKSLVNKIVVIDGRALKYWGEKAGIEWPQNIPLLSPPDDTHSELLIDSYIKATRLGSENTQFFYMSFYNTTKKNVSFVLFTQNDETWCFTENSKLHPEETAENILEQSPGLYEKTVVLPPLRSTALRLCGKFNLDLTAEKGLAQQQHGDREQGARISIRFGQRIIPVFQDYPPLEICFTPPFFGEENVLLKEELKKEFSSLGRPIQKPKFKMIHIEGAAGVGKSRLVEEFLPGRHNSSAKVIIHTIEAQKKKRGGFDKIQSQLREITDLSGINFNYVKDPETLLSCLISADIQNNSTFGNWGTIVCVFEDMHNAPKKLCDQILDLVQSDHSLSVRIVLILTARNDDSFLNPAYLELAGLLKGEKLKFGQGVEKPISKEVFPLPVKEAKGMINDLIEGIRPTGVKRIYALSGSVPHHIVQCIEYLLDESLVSIDGRNSLSIIDLYTFEKRSEDLPSNMEKLFAQRFINLGETENGQAAQEAILAATSFGTHFPQSVCGIISRVELKRIKHELINRRFFKRTEKANEEEMEWSHENLLLFFSNLKRKYVQGLMQNKNYDDIAHRYKENSIKILKNDDIFNVLPPLQKGNILALSRNNEEAWQYFKPIIQAAQSVKTFGTMEFETIFFDHIEYLVLVILDTDKYRDEELLWKLLVIKAYVGGVHKGLRFAIQALDFARAVLKKTILHRDNEQLCKLWLQAINAHVHMDSGFIGLALEQLLQLVGVYQLANVKDVTMSFDMHNSLRIIYTYCNFRQLSDTHGDLASQCIADVYGKTSEQQILEGAKKLQDINLGDRAMACFFTNRSDCLVLLKKGFRLNARQGEKRHEWHIRASMIAGHLPDYYSNTNKLKKYAQDVEELLIDCQKNNYDSIRPRLYLLRATLEYFHGIVSPQQKTTYFDNAFVIAEKGLNATEAYSIGFIGWQLQNLLAIIDQHQGRDEQALKRMDTAIALMEKEGLFFLGRGAVISATPIIYANYIKIFRAFGHESKISNLLRKLRGFEQYHWDRREYRVKILKTVDKFHHIMTDYQQTPDGLLLDAKTNFALIFWF